MHLKNSFSVFLKHQNYLHVIIELDVSPYVTNGTTDNQIAHFNHLRAGEGDSGQCYASQNSMVFNMNCWIFFWIVHVEKNQIQ